MARPLKRERGISRTLVLHSAIKMFIEKGYSNTKIHDISNECGVTYNEIYRMFVDKETLLSHLVDLVIEHQFEFADKFLKDKFQFVPVLYIMILPKCSISDVWEGLFRVRCIEIIILFGCIDVEIIILFEMMQYIFKRGVFDIVDILINYVGVLIITGIFLIIFIIGMIEKIEEVFSKLSFSLLISILICLPIPITQPFSILKPKPL